MSLQIMVWLEGAGTVDVVPAEMDPRQEGLTYGYCLPREPRPLQDFCAQLGLRSVFAFTAGFDEASELAETEVFGKPEGDLSDEDEIIFDGIRLGTPAQLTDVQWDRLHAEVHRLRDGLMDWFAPEEGLATFGPLAAYVELHPDCMVVYEGDPYYNIRDGVLWDLRAITGILRSAAQIGTRFRLWYN